MSYDLAVWEGERPASSQEALATHLALYEQYVEDDKHVSPTPLIVNFVETLLQRWPELSDDEDTPWSTEPLIGEARGPYIYFPMSWSRAEEASAFAVTTAAKLGLTCFDPQMNELRS